jgi:hypothetical protein
MDPGTANPTLAEVKAYNVRAATQIRNDAIKGGVTFRTFPIGTDVESRGNVSGISIFAIINNLALPTGFVWPDATGATHNLSASDLAIITTIEYLFLGANYRNAAIHFTNIAALADVPTAIAYDVTTGWPAQLEGTTNPLTTGVVANVGSVFFKTDINEVFVKTGAGNTAWEKQMILGQPSVTRSDVFTGIANGATLDASSKPMGSWSIQVKGTGAAPTSWNVVLEGSLNGVNFTIIATHSATDGSTVFSGAPKFPVLFVRSRVTALTLGTATNIVVTILGIP